MKRIATVINDGEKVRMIQGYLQNGFSRITFFLILTLFVHSQFFLFPSTVFGQNQTAQPSGISVTPSILRVDLETDPSEIDLIYTNHSQDEILLEFSAVDFSELQDGWQVKFLEPNDAKNYSYSLSSWLEFEKRSESLKPGEQKQIKVFINKEELSPGGHYASIQANISAIDKGDEQVEIKGLLSSLLFVRTNSGKEVEQATINDLIAERRSFFHFPELFVLRFNNQGNTELMPFGKLRLHDFFGREIATGILNEGGNYSLPQSIKRFPIKLQSQSAPILPGFYQAEIDLRFGDSDQTIKYQSQFFYLDWKVAIFIVIAFAVALISIKKWIQHMKKKT